MPSGVDRLLENRAPRRASSLDGCLRRPSQEEDFEDFDYSDEFDEDDGELESLDEKVPDVAKKTVTFSNIPPQRTSVTTKPPKKAAPSPLASDRRSLFSVVQEVVFQSRMAREGQHHNIVRELRQQLKAARQENATLRQVNRRQEKALDRVEGAEADLPRLLARHNDDMSVMQDQLRRYKEELLATRRQVKGADMRIQQQKTELNQLRDLAGQHDLKQRQALTQQVSDLANRLEQKSARIEVLEKYIKNLENNFKIQIQRETVKLRDIRKTCTEQEQRTEEMRKALQEKEKIIEEFRMQEAIANRRSSRRRSSLLALPAPPEALIESSTLPRRNTRTRIQEYDCRRRTSQVRQKPYPAVPPMKIESEPGTMVFNEQEDKIVENSKVTDDCTFTNNSPPDEEKKPSVLNKNLEENSCENGSYTNTIYHRHQCDTPVQDENLNGKGNNSEDVRADFDTQPEKANENDAIGAAAYQPTFLTALRCESASATMDSRRDSTSWRIPPRDAEELQAEMDRQQRYRSLKEAQEDEDRRKESLLIRIKALDDKLNMTNQYPINSSSINNQYPKKEFTESYELPPVSPPSKPAPERERQLLVELFGEKCVKNTPGGMCSKSKLTQRNTEKTSLPWEVMSDFD